MRFSINKYLCDIMAFSFDLAVIFQRERRMKRKSRDLCKSHEPMPYIPFDLVIEILNKTSCQVPYEIQIRLKALVIFDLFPNVHQPFAKVFFIYTASIRDFELLGQQPAQR